MWRKAQIIGVFLVFLFTGIVSATQVRAQTDPPETPGPTPTPLGQAGVPGTGIVFNAEYYQKDKAQYEAALADCGTPSLECLVHYTSTYVAIEWLDRIIGVTPTSTTPDPNNPDSGLFDRGKTVADNSHFQGSFVGGMSHLIGEMYRQPVAQTNTYLADLREGLRLAPPAYAQGLGFAALNPVLNLWKIFRNLAYVFFVIILIVLGFMIMLRKKIGGQAAVTAQQAIPSVVISLIFVTFSYAIAGLLIDMMYLSMFLIVGLFENTAGFQDNIINFDIFELSITLFSGPTKLNFTSGIVETFLAGLTDSVAGKNIIGFIGGLTLSLVIAIVILINTFKLFFELLSAYARVVLHVVTAPIFLMLGAIPGKNVFGAWVKQIVGNLLPFPTVLLIVVMFYFFTQNIGADGASGGFMPPFLFGRGQSSTIASLMGLAIMLALPDIVKHFREEVAGKGGIGELIYGWAKDAGRGAWSNKYVGLGGGLKKTTGKALDLATKPILGVGGAVAGGYYGNRFADEAGLTGWKRGLAVAGGIGAGYNLGVRAPKAVKGIVSGTARQARDSIIKIKTEQFRSNLEGAFTRDAIDVQHEVAESQKAPQGDVPASGYQQQAPSRNASRYPASKPKNSH